MARPKKYVRPIIRRKCHHCGKMATKPFTFQIVPSYSDFTEIPVYLRGGVKIPRTELKGDRKIQEFHYCNQECYRFASLLDA